MKVSENGGRSLRPRGRALLLLLGCLLGGLPAPPARAGFPENRRPASPGPGGVPGKRPARLPGHGRRQLCRRHRRCRLRRRLTFTGSHVTGVTVSYGSGAPTSVDKQWSFTYDGVTGEVSSVTDPLGNVTHL